MASYATLNINNIKTRAWDNLYKFFKDDSNYKLSTNRIYSSYNDLLAFTTGYPIVIINPPRVSVNPLTMGGAISEVELDFSIDVYDDNSADTKALADEVYEGLYNGKSEFAKYQMYHKSIEKSELDMWIKDSKKIHKITINVIFRYVGS